MASTPLELRLPTGLTLTVSLFPLGSDTASASGKTLTEATNAKGFYTATITEALAGIFRAVVLESSTTIARGLVYIEDDTNTWREITESEVRTISQDRAAADNLESACDNYSATRGLAGTALPAAAADAAGGLVISDTGGFDIDNRTLSAAAITNAEKIAINTIADSGTVNADGSETATSFKTNLTIPFTNAWIDLQCRFTSGDLAGQTKVISTCTVTGGLLAFDEGFSQAPANGDAFDIISLHVHSIGRLASGLWTTDLSGISIPSPGGYLKGAAQATALATVSTNVSTLLTRIPAALFSGITSLAQWLGMMAGKQTPDATAQTEIRATGAGSGGYDATRESLEGLRDQGDAAWITATGFAEPGDEMDLVNAPNATALTAIGAKVEAMVFDEGDATALLAAIAAKVEEFLINEGDATATLASIATAVWAAGTRTLTAGTNLNDLSAADVRAAVGLAAANLDTQLADLPTVAEFEARTLVAASYFDPAADTVAHVTLVDTTTANTDMRGTDSAATAAELAKVPKSDGTASWNATALAAINAEVVDTLQTDTPVAGVSIVETLRRCGAMTSGEVSNAGSGEETFKDYANSVNTIVVVVDSSGNRTSITYN